MENEEFLKDIQKAEGFILKVVIPLTVLGGALLVSALGF